jgi:hypothetical protein
VQLDARQHSAISSAPQERQQQLIAWLIARDCYEAAYDAWRASPDVDSDRRRIRALEDVADARAAVLAEARQ